MVKTEDLKIHILCLRLLELFLLITLVASFLSWHASLILKRNFYVTGNSYCYSLGMVKMEAFDDSHFMHQAVRGGHTDHTGSIISPMACIFDLKKNSSQSYCYSLGMVKTEAFEDSHFMHQAVRGGHTDHTGSIVSLMVCIFDLKKKFLCNWTLIKIVLYRRAIALVW